MKKGGGQSLSRERFKENSSRKQDKGQLFNKSLTSRKNIANDNNRVALCPQQTSTELFDDSVYFRTANKNYDILARSSQKSKTKKCSSQIINVKYMQSPVSFDNLQNRPNTRGFDEQCHMNIVAQFFNQKEIKSSRIHHSSYSNRRKYSTLKAYAGDQQNTQRAISSREFQSRKATLKPNISETQVDSPDRTWIRQKFFLDYRQTETPKTQRKRQRNPQNIRKKNFLQYSIFRPDEIKAKALHDRQQQSINFQRRRRQQKALYLQMLHQLKRKEELINKNMKLKIQIENSAKKGERKGSGPISQVNGISQRGKVLSYQERNQVRPWDVELGMTQTNYAEMI